MSRAIIIRISESVTRVVHVEDGVQSPLEMLPILTPERQAEILARELEDLGFEHDGDTCKRTDPDGVEVIVDLRGATVSVKLGADSNLKESLARQASTSDEGGLRDQVLAEIDVRLNERTEALRRQITQQLERKLGDLRTELDGAIGRATVSALTERAAQLGEIESLLGDEAGNLTIKVKL